MKLLSKYCCAVIGVALFGVVSSTHASDIKNSRVPVYDGDVDIKNSRVTVYDGVKRVYVFVNYHDGGEQSDIPASLKRETLEELIAGLYRKRFSSKDCKSVMGGKNPYSCDDQPVTIIPDADATKFSSKMDISVATQDELRDPDTLLVTLDVNFIRDQRKDNPDYDKNVFFDPHLEVPLVAYQLRMERRISRIGLDSTEWIMPPFALPINQKDEKIDAMITSLIKGRLHY